MKQNKTFTATETIQWGVSRLAEKFPSLEVIEPFWVPQAESLCWVERFTK